MPSSINVQFIGTAEFVPRALVELLNQVSNPDCDDQFPLLTQKAGLARVALHGGLLFFTFGCHLGLLCFSYSHGWSAIMQWCLYVLGLTTFHVLEFLMTALYNPRTCTADSFLINHSKAYTIAAIASWVEFWVEMWLWPGIKGATWTILFGTSVVFVGQFCRTLAMYTAGKSFHHIVQVNKDSRHRLITTGIYSLLRHPSYFGWFWWSIGTQVLLGNPFCVICYAFASRDFFANRIPFEEQALRQMYPKQYEAYCERTPVLIPFL